MQVILKFVEVLIQAATVILTLWGWGEILGRIGWLPLQKGRFQVMMRLTAGLAALTLFLLALYSFEIPVKYSAWLVLGIAVTGLGMMAGKFMKALKNKHIVCREFAWTGIVFIFVLLCQASPVIYIGPDSYHGIQRQDQMSYAIWSQYCVDEPMDVRETPSQTKPWLHLAAQLMTNARLGQNMLTSYVSTVLGVDTYRIFGTLSAFYIAFMAASVFGCLRCIRLPRILAAAGALWSGLANGITYSSTNAFFANSSILFVLPSIVALLLSCRKNLNGVCVCYALLLAYTASCYICMSPLVLFIFVALFVVIGGAAYERCFRQISLIAALTLIFFAPSLSKVVSTVRLEANLGFANEQAWEKMLSNDSGTWKGLRELFFADITSSTFPQINAVALVLSFVFITVILAGIHFSRGYHRIIMFALTASTLLFPVVLLLIPPFKHYVFFKVCTTLLPLLIILITCGFHTTAIQSGTRPGNCRQRLWMASAIVLVMMTLSFISSALSWKTVIALAGKMENNSPTALALYDYVRHHAGETYYLTDSNAFRATWLAYHARHSNVYLRHELLYDGCSEARPPQCGGPPPQPPYIILDGVTFPPVCIER